MLRALLSYLVLGVTTVLGGIAVIIIGLFQSYSPISYGIARTWSRILLWVAGIRVTVEGAEHIEGAGPYVVVSNHQSHTDIPVLLYHIPLHLTIIAKKELFRIPIFGQGMRGLGILSIDRSNRRKSIETLNRAGEILRLRKISVLAFPEGTRSMDGAIHPFKKGPFMLALTSGIPILPVTVEGTFPILPKGKLKVQPGHVRVVFHPPVAVNGYGTERRDELIADVHKAIADRFYATV